MRNANSWSLLAEHEGHVVLVASDRGRLGSVYCGQIIRRSARFEAFFSRDLVTIGAVEPVGKSYPTVEAAEAALAKHAIQLASKLHYAGAGGLIRPLITRGES